MVLVRAHVHAATAYKTCNSRAGWEGKSRTPTAPPGPGGKEETRDKRGKRFYAQAVKHTTAAEERQRKGRRKKREMPSTEGREERRPERRMMQTGVRE